MLYLDNNATTPLAPEVLEAMLPYLTQHFGNPASKQHAYGWIAEESVDHARTRIAAILEAEPAEIVFTSGATEACNLAIKGVFHLYRRKGQHIITVATEHKAVLDTCRYIASLGAQITILPVDKIGNLDLEMLCEAIRPDTILVTAMWANNETGVIHPVQEIGRICEEKGTMFFSDATQAVGKVPVHPREDGVQLLALSAHKLHGPKGVGALYISRRSPRVKLSPLIHGGGHEEGVRSGTLNVPGIVGLGKALDISAANMQETAVRLAALRDAMEKELMQMPAVQINGDTTTRMPHVSNLCFEGIDGGALMASLSKELAIASGSACTSANPEPSHVLEAMGLSRDEAKSSLRISLGRQNTDEEVRQATGLVMRAVETLREQSVAWRMRSNIR